MRRKKSQAHSPSSGDPATRPFASNLGAELDPILAHLSPAKRILNFRRKQCIFSQGGPADAVFYIQKGRVKLCIAATSGKEATIAVLGPGDFLGEECLRTKQGFRNASAFAVTDSMLLRIDKKEMNTMLKQEPAVADLFIAFLLDRNARAQENLADLLFNPTEKRLARALLTLAQLGESATGVLVVPRTSQEALASMIGTTRSRVNMLMNRFRRQGVIHYDGELKVNSSLLNVLLND
jgi:CRP/FNR family transcriptional regulator, cyclic AMP receptor protein